jgi:hypothetical protein
MHSSNITEVDGMTGQSTCVSSKEEEKENPNFNALLLTKETSLTIKTMSRYRTVLND